MSALAAELYGDSPKFDLASELYGQKKPRQPDALDNPNPADVPWYENLAAGAGKAVADAGRGLGQIAGLVSQKDIDEAKLRDAPLMKTGAGIAGNIGGNVAMLAPTALIPGANTVAGAGIIGGVQGVLLNGGNLEERLKEGALGAAGGAVGAGVANALGKTSFGPSDAVKTLRAAGIGITPGQNLGRMASNIEEKLTSLPFTGAVIQNARDRGVKDLNEAALARASLNGRGVLPSVNAGGEIGGEGLSNLRQGFQRGYDNVAQSSNAVPVLDPAFVGAMTNIRGNAQGLPADLAREFDRVLGREIDGRVAGGALDGQALKDAVSAIRERGTQFKASGDQFQRDLGGNLSNTASELMALAGRVNPQNAAELRALDNAYANFKIAQRASSSTGAENGVFSPSQLLAAVKAKDRTLDKRAFSEGDARLQDLAAKAKEVLAPKVGDSGTAGRWSMQNIPSLAVGAAGAIPAAVIYSRAGQAATNWLVNNGIKATPEAIRNLIAKNPAIAGTTGMALADLVR